MGTGIVAAIPIVIGPYTHGWEKEIQKEYFSDGFFDGYTVDEEKGIYTIKPQLLLSNYLSFLNEFFDCIEEKDDLGTVPNISAYDEFKAAFDRKERNAQPPYIDYQGNFLSILGGKCEEFWLFYRGSYKAYLEEYSTLVHFERTLTRAIKNPIASLVKFGIYG